MKLLQAYYAPESLRGKVVPWGEYRPFPRYGEKNPLTPEQKKQMISCGEAYLSYDWPVARATDYMKFKTCGDRGPYEGKNYTFRRNALSCLMDAEYAEQQGRFIPAIIDGVWAIMDEATWVVPAHNGDELPDFDKPWFIDLFSAGTAGLLADAYNLFKEPIDAVSPLVLRRMERLMEERIMAPFMQNLYWWSGLAGRDTCNWGPWILSNVLTVFGVFCKDEARRDAAVSFACLQLDQFIKLYGEDGGCDEGPGYWGHAAASLFDCLCILSDLTRGAFDTLFDEPLVRNLAEYICHAHVGGEYFANYEDARFHARVSYDLVYRFGKKIKSRMMEQFGVALYRLYIDKDGGTLKTMPNTHAHYRYMSQLCSFAELDAAGEGAFPLEESVFLPQLEMIAERQTGGSTQGLYLSAKAGRNNISHNHNDIGSFMLFSDGSPVLVDIGSGQYTSKTFSDSRYEIFWTTGAYHNLPVFNGVDQKVCTEKETRGVSYEKNDGVTVFSADIARCYPASAGVTDWQRTFTFDRVQNCVRLEDKGTFAQDENRVEWMFLSPVCPIVTAEGVLFRAENGRDVLMTVPESLTVDVQEVGTQGDSALEENWGKCLYRTVVSAKTGKEAQAEFVFEQV